MLCVFGDIGCFRIDFPSQPSPTIIVFLLRYSRLPQKTPHLSSTTRAADRIGAVSVSSGSAGAGSALKANVGAMAHLFRPNIIFCEDNFAGKSEDGFA